MVQDDSNCDSSSGVENPRSFTPLQLDPFIEPLVNSTRILSYLDPHELQGVGGAAAYKWLASLAANRAHELYCIINGHRPLYDTGMRSSERASIILSMPKL
jgi:hypothetical protein